MSLLKTTKIIQNGNKFNVEIPQECMEKLGWRNGHILQIDVENSQAVIKKLQGFVGV